MFLSRYRLVATAVLCCVTSVTFAGSPVDQLPLIELEENPTVVLADFETGVVIWRDPAGGDFMSADGVHLQHMLADQPFAIWGIGQSLPESRTVTGVSSEVFATKDGDGYACVLSGKSDAEMEFVALLRSENAFDSFQLEFAIHADDARFPEEVIDSPRMLLWPSVLMVPLSTKGPAPTMLYGIGGLIEGMDGMNGVIALPFGMAYVPSMSSDPLFAAPDLLNKGIVYSSSAFGFGLGGSSQRSGLTKGAGGTRLVYGVSESSDTIREQVWDYPDDAVLGDLAHDVSLGMTGVSVEPQLGSWRDWGRSITDLYSPRSLMRGDGDPFDNKEGVGFLTENSLMEDSWLSSGGLLIDPGSPVPAVISAIFWFSGPVDLNNVTANMAKGDADGSGTVDRADAKAFFTFFAGLTPKPEWDQDQADMDDDGNVDFADRELFVERLAIADAPASPRKAGKGPVPVVTRDESFWNPAIGFVDWGFDEFPGVPNYSAFGGTDIQSLADGTKVLILTGLDNMGGFSSKGENLLMHFDPQTGYTSLASTFDPDLMDDDPTNGTFFESLSNVDDAGRLVMVVEEKTDESRSFTIVAVDLQNDPIVIPPAPGTSRDLWAVK